MTSNIFFSSNINSNNLYKYEESFLEFIIAKKIYESGPMAEDQIIKWVSGFYCSSIKQSKFVKFISSRFYYDENKYGLTTIQKASLDKTTKFKRDLFQLEWENEDDIYKKLNENFLRYYEFDVTSAAKYVLTLKKIKHSLSMDETLSKYYTFLINLDFYHISVDTAINCVDESYFDIPVSLLFRDSISRKIFFSNGIDTIKKLFDSSISFILTSFSADYDFSINAISCLNNNGEKELPLKLKAIFESLSEKEFDIISARNGFFGSKKTLEEIGLKYNFSRERTRQIESKATKKIADKSFEIQNQIYAMFFNLAKVEKRYITVETINKYLESELLTNYLLFIISIANLNIKYDQDLCILYNSDLTSANDLCKEVIDIYGIFISINDFNGLNQFEKNVIKSNYRLINNTMYIEKPFGTKELVGIVLDEYFSKGYRIGSSADYEMLKEKFEEKFGECDDFVSDRSIVGFIERLGFCQIDKGTYTNRTNCVSLPGELVDKIINYILMNGPTVFYQSIYSKFETELTDLGINNYFYLKGLLDPLLPSDFKTKRNYISSTDNFMSSYDAILGFMRSFNGEFAISDLRKKFEGVKDYTLYNAIYSEIENGLVWLSGKTFIYLDKVLISDEAKKGFKQFIDNMFAIMGTSAISSRKIYAKMSLTNKSLLQSLKIANDNFSTFSLIKCLYPNDYGFNRPIISRDKNEQITSYNLIVNYVANLDSFNLKAINNYVSKMNIRGLYSYLSFMEDMSDEFVQVNIETMVKKNKVNITQNELNDIRKLIELIVKRFGKLDTRQFNGYQMFPDIGYHWNKYLLAGIVRTYLSDKFSMENTTNFYKTPQCT